ncbi:FtsH protease activity modulator HflK [Novispirillum sp. DQ9]|uniref:FtsH protease activity modulator HflK n=1 Tax=Novispirillum sp. DQ9 TaxID=3398612 RepID=UPI003C7CC6C4
MAWNQQGGGGPWGGGGGGGGPWGGGGSGGGGPNWGGGGRGSPPPDIEDMLRKLQDRSRRFMPGGFGSGKGVALLVVAVIAAWGLTGFYRVQPDQQGVELLFGRYVKTTAPGLNYWFPAPIGEVETPTVTRTNQISIGFRGDPRGGTDRDVPQESLMLTGDQNIIDADFIVQWRIADAGDYLFNIRDVEDTVKLAAESAVREVIGQVELEYAMTQGRGVVASRARDLLQQIMDSYGAGVSILDLKLQQADPPAEVIDAFQDVQRARQDRERLQNEAYAYRNDILPRAQGQAERVIQAATAYREQMTKTAEGEASRFLSVYETYRNSRDVTTQRLYLEAIQDVLKGSEKILLDEGASGSGVVPYLPLPEIQKRATREASTAGAPNATVQREAGR